MSFIVFKWKSYVGQLIWGRRIVGENTGMNGGEDVVDPPIGTLG